VGKGGPDDEVLPEKVAYSTLSGDVGLRIIETLAWDKREFSEATGAYLQRTISLDGRPETSRFWEKT